MRRTGVSAEQIANVNDLRFEWRKGWMFIHWAVIEDIPGAAVLKEPAPGRTNKERVLVNRLAWSLREARENAECWLGIYRLSETPKPKGETESIRDMLAKMPF